ncbi:MAG: hypothetical protein ACKO0N_09320 [Planctomycetota bacterium]
MSPSHPGPATSRPFLGPARRIRQDGIDQARHITVVANATKAINTAVMDMMMNEFIKLLQC